MQQLAVCRTYRRPAVPTPSPAPTRRERSETQWWYWRRLRPFAEWWEELTRRHCWDPKATRCRLTRWLETARWTAVARCPAPWRRGTNMFWLDLLGPRKEGLGSSRGTYLGVETVAAGGLWTEFWKRPTWLAQRGRKWGDRSPQSHTHAEVAAEGLWIFQCNFVFLIKHGHLQDRLALQTRSRKKREG